MAAAAAYGERSATSWLRNLLWIDCTAALLAGVAVLLVRTWLAGLYGLPENLLLAIGIVNLAYGCFSFSLAVAPRRRTKSRILTLAFANQCWAVGCIATGAAYIGVANFLGLAQLIGEGVFVGTLGVLEWRARERLVTERAFDAAERRCDQLTRPNQTRADGQQKP